MTNILAKATGRRGFLGGLAATGGLLALPACSTIPGFGMVDAVQRILFLSWIQCTGAEILLPIGCVNMR